MRPNPQFPADLVTFTEAILNGKLQLHFLCSGNNGPADFSERMIIWEINENWHKN